MYLFSVCTSMMVDRLFPSLIPSFFYSLLDQGESEESDKDEDEEEDEEEEEDGEEDEDTDNLEDSNETSKLLCPPKTTSEIIITPMTLTTPSSSMYHQTFPTIHSKPDHKNVKEDV